MIYLAELYYLQDQKEFPFRQAVLATAAAVSRWSSYYSARLIATRSKSIAPQSKSGPLPPNMVDRAALVADLVSWLFENSMSEELFYLMLEDEPKPGYGRVAKFDHHDDTGSWALDLTRKEFAELQAEWVALGLPDDLFYPEEESFLLPYPGSGLKARLLRFIGMNKFYTPRQWEQVVGRKSK